MPRLFLALWRDIVERVEFKVSETSAMWVFHLCKDTPPTMSTAWRYSYTFFHGTETGSLWRVMCEKTIKPALSDEDAVGFYCRVAVLSDNDLDIKHAVNRVMTSGKWATPGIIGGNVEITSQQAIMNFGGSEAQDACRLRGVVHMRCGKKWIIRSEVTLLKSILSSFH